MARIKISLPEQFSFTTLIPIRITDLNYGSHVGNDTILSLLHEARAQYLQHYGYSELSMAGKGLIMSDVGIEYKKELFYGDQLQASVTAAEFSKMSFDVYYKLEKIVDGRPILVVAAKTGMVCFDYTTRKIGTMPQEVIEKLQG
ncbi:MAG: thioesterase family protein [Candidatus Pseudobacter hemicellulosilyticus]|uniref:Thioesterase family protein n=1 Tax=Candidatus Pseudobacter hemicellulosilyticus TaxID=3121375 RepID=A0AAJ5WTM2_9BACT|nr:MAG: thioesterase family protein [Pseudobacter sp.]